MLLGSLFSGIGGLDWGLEEGLSDALGVAVGTAWQAECNDYSRAILARSWPRSTQYADVRDVGRHSIAVDGVGGGSPCQSLSLAGKRALFSQGSKSSLWFEMARVIDEVHPAFVVWENVGGALCPKREKTSVGRVSISPAPILRILSDLDEMGYDAFWTTGTAAEVGASHLRLRVFVLGIRRGDASISTEPSDGTYAKRGAHLAFDRWTHAQSRGRSGNRSAHHEPRRSRPDSHVPFHMERIEALGNSVVPQLAYTVGVVLAGLLANLYGARFYTNRVRGAAGAVALKILPHALAVVNGRGRHYARIDRRECTDPKDPLCGTQPTLGAMIAGELYDLPKARRPSAHSCTFRGCDDELPPSGMWPTATARDWRSGKTGPATAAKGNARPLNEVAAPDGFLEPEWVDLHMGFGPGYTALPAEAIPARKRGSKPCAPSTPRAPRTPRKPRAKR